MKIATPVLALHRTLATALGGAIALATSCFFGGAVHSGFNCLPTLNERATPVVHAKVSRWPRDYFLSTTGLCRILERWYANEAEQKLYREKGGYPPHTSLTRLKGAS